MSLFFTDKEWLTFSSDQHDVLKQMYIHYKLGLIPKPTFVKRYDKWINKHADSSEAVSGTTPKKQDKLEIRKERMRKKLEKIRAEKGVRECLEGFSQLEIDESKNELKKVTKLIEKLEEELGSDDEDLLWVRRPKNPKRKTRHNVNYNDNIDRDDSLMWCDLCDEAYTEFCPKHGPLLVIPDFKVSEDSKLSVAEQSFPTGYVRLGESSIKGAGQGTWTSSCIPIGVRFGPYRGVITAKSCAESAYIWELNIDEKKMFLDASDPEKSNWMRYTNCARSIHEQNLQAFQFKGKIYYRTVRNIPENTELLVWYGSHYARLLGIDPAKYHLKELPNEEDGLHPCDYCDVIYTKKSYLQKHYKYCRSKRTYENKTYIKPNAVMEIEKINDKVTFRKDASNINVQCNQKRDSKEHKRFECDQCDFKSNRARNLQTHKRIHTGEKPFACDRCDYKCNLPSNLQTHKRIHTGEKPFACDRCDYICNQACSLQRHKRIHTGEKPFACDRCDYKCNLAYNLQTHKQIHTGEKPFACDQCDYKCIQGNQLKTHKRNHTGEKLCK